MLSLDYNELSYLSLDQDSSDIRNKSNDIYVNKGINIFFKCNVNIFYGVC